MVKTQLLSATVVLGLAAGLVPAAWAQSVQTAPAAPSRAAPATASSPSPKPALTDINSASREELDALPGIGAARSEAIIKGRPYKGKDELLRRKVIPANVYDGIKDRIIAKHS